MNDFVVNLFATSDLEGSAAAVLAHVYAKKHDGAVTVRRLDTEKTDIEVEGLVRLIEESDPRHLKIATHIEIWVGNIPIDDRVNDALLCLYNNDPFRRGLCFESPLEIPYGCRIPYDAMSTAMLTFLTQVEAATKYDVANDIRILHDMLQPDDFVDVITHLITQNPYGFDINSDYNLHMFVSNEKRRRLSSF